MTITWLDYTDSTQDALFDATAAEPERWPHLSALATLDQRSGRGRRGRQWTTPAGTALSVSVVLRPELSPEHFSWVTLVAAAATVRELERRGVPAQVKWPNDILAEDGRKLCGILATVLPQSDQAPPGLVLGLGLNLDFGPHGAPVDTATSIAEWLPARTPVDPAELLSSLLEAIGVGLEEFADSVREHPGAVDGMHPAARAVVGRLGTLGSKVTLQLPDGSELTGLAAGLGSGGTLLVDPGTEGSPSAEGEHGKMDGTVSGGVRNGNLREISSADVVHLRR
ncbi:biotin--[acetyl-CoA-carboxylase] ligase [Citricoccus sp. GCM10030269]|uniref:biotin--[acetyl-CoA-carboxylase] ligase n=1 Tax=Citricoccus sp. GCM10030269 TaxID=3273388 RepID=UPI00361ED4A5